MDSEERRKRIAEAKSLEDLQELGAELGYKEGWAAHVWASREGYRARNNVGEEV